MNVGRLCMGTGGPQRDSSIEHLIIMAIFFYSKKFIYMVKSNSLNILPCQEESTQMSVPIHWHVMTKVCSHGLPSSTNKIKARFYHIHQRTKSVIVLLLHPFLVGQNLAQQPPFESKCSSIQHLLRKQKQSHLGHTDHGTFVTSWGCNLQQIYYHEVWSSLHRSASLLSNGQQIHHLLG